MKKRGVANRLWLAILVPAVLFLGGAALGQENTSPLLVIISVDGMKPEYVTAADAHGEKVPNLRCGGRERPRMRSSFMRWRRKD